MDLSQKQSARSAFLRADHDEQAKIVSNVMRTSKTLQNMESAYGITSNYSSHAAMGSSERPLKPTEISAAFLDLAPQYCYYFIGETEKDITFRPAPQGKHEWSSFIIDGVRATELPAIWPILSEVSTPLSESTELYKRLFVEATTLRSATIPPSAFVEVDIPPYNGVYLLEQRNRVRLAWATPNNIFSFLVLELSGDRGQFGMPGFAHLGMGPDRHKHVLRPIFSHPDDPDVRHLIRPKPPFPIPKAESTYRSFGVLRAISMSIIRDFWVVENKDRATRLGSPRIKKMRNVHGRPTNRVVYLPRTRYARERFVESVATERLWEVSPHWVRSHFRRLQDGSKATQKQIALASLHNTTIPSGHTWVKGHSVGDAEDDRVYRSRSATRAILQILPPMASDKELQGLTWFEFERLCELLLEQRKMTIHEKIGDHGIDIIASDNDGWAFAQCKHWDRPVGPGAVRDLVGAGARLPQELGVIRLLLMSSSGFSVSARVEASRAGIELVHVRSEVRE